LDNRFGRNFGDVIALKGGTREFFHKRGVQIINNKEAFGLHIAKIALLFMEKKGP
jgi:hypothetical protein